MIGKIKNKKTEFTLFSVFQICLIIGSLIFNSYIISSYHFLDENVIEEGKNFVKLLDVGFDFLVSLLTVKQIGIVSATSHDSSWCCTETNSGALCQDVPIGDSSSCSNPSPTSCEAISECRLGTCINEEHGTCSANSPKRACEDSEGNWDSRELNEIPQCRLGCCVLGNNVNFVTETQCELISESNGLDKDFQSGLTEQECIAISTSLVKGACVLPGNNCRFVTGAACIDELGGSFFEGDLCTDPDLGTNCKPTEETKCSDTEGEYDVYFKDSCGNIANIYYSSEIFDGTFDGDDEYWETVQEPGCSEEPNSPTCGVCEYPTESRCLPVRSNDNVEYGDFICRDLNCGNVDRLNGESWCVYESFVGESKDVVGSDHWLRYCEDGEVKIDETQNKYRGDVCAQNDLELGNGELFSIAQYRINQWPLCLSLIEDERDREECGDIPDCRVLNVRVSESVGFVFDLCVPKYPKGFDLDITADKETQEELCGLATQTCTWVETKKSFVSSWKTFGDSDNCKNGVFTKQMNNFCSSLGDCGGYVNVEGEYTKNYRVDRGDVDLSNEYDTYSNPSDEDDKPLHIPNPDDSGSYGDLGNLVGREPDFEEITVGDVIGVLSGDLGDIIEDIEKKFGNFFTGLIADIIGGDVRKHPIRFTCEPWQAPVGGSDCSKCNEGDLPCTQYKCNSLGTACNLINEDIEGVDSICVNRFPDDSTPPIINFLGVENIFTGEVYNFSEKTNGVEINDCIEDLSTVNISLETEDAESEGYARCMYDFIPTAFSEIALAENQDISNVYSLGDNAFYINHNFEEILSISKEEVYDIIEGDEETTGKLSMYMRCQDPAGNPNPKEYEIRFSCISSEDKTAPFITEFNPEDGSFLKFEDTSTNLEISLNEPAECRYDFNEGVSYENMANNFESCILDHISGERLEGSCTTDLIGLTEDENTIYIRCKDTSDNVNAQDTPYTLFATPSPLTISAISTSVISDLGIARYDLIENPGVEILGGGIYFSVDLEATTSGGSAEGDAVCSYKFEEAPILFSTNLFFETDEKTHKQAFASLINGNYNIKITCEDSSGNEAEANALFDLKIDASAPNIVRAFKDGSKLTLISNEEAICYYSNDKLRQCNFNVDDAIKISSIFSTQHSVDWDRGKTYFVKCKDLFENTNNGCAIKVNPA